MSTQNARLAAAKRGAKAGVIGGLAGAAVMAMYAMVVSAFVKDTGFFTPLYHIASSIISPQAMMTSMEAAAADSTHFAAGPAFVGLLVHMVVGATAGALFGAIAGWSRLSRAITVAAGAAFGLVLMGVNAFIALPVVASLFGGGDPIADMAQMVGWPTFTIEHLLYGLVLGAIVAAMATRRVDAPHGRVPVHAA